MWRLIGSLILGLAALVWACGDRGEPADPESPVIAEPPAEPIDAGDRDADAD